MENKIFLQNYHAVFLEICNKAFNEILREMKDQNLMEAGFSPQEMELSFILNIKNKNEEKLRVVCNPKIIFTEKLN